MKNAFFSIFVFYDKNEKRVNFLIFGFHFKSKNPIRPGLFGSQLSGGGGWNTFHHAVSF